MATKQNDPDQPAATLPSNHPAGPERGSVASGCSSVPVNETKTVVAGWEAIRSVPLKPGWKRSEFSDEGKDEQGQQLIGVIDRQVFYPAD
jgi:hypothetical protein